MTDVVFKDHIIYDLEQSIICNECFEDKNIGEYYRSKRVNGEYINPKCKECCKKASRERSHTEKYVKMRKKQNLKVRSNPILQERAKGYSKKHYNSLEGRAKSMLKTSKRRSSKFSNVLEEEHVDLEFIMSKLKLGKCEVTGIPFEYENLYPYSTNPLAPSIDRIDSKVGYTKSNCRIVIWQYNLMKGELTDDEVISIFYDFFKNLKGG